MMYRYVNIFDSTICTIGLTCTSVKRVMGAQEYIYTYSYICECICCLSNSNRLFQHVDNQETKKEKKHLPGL